MNPNLLFSGICLQDKVCPEGFKCVLQQVQCIRAPCPPIPQCVGKLFVRKNVQIGTSIFSKY